MSRHVVITSRVLAEIGVRLPGQARCQDTEEVGVTTETIVRMAGSHKRAAPRRRTA
jgi:hypothetical protein